ncbi:MAG: hypothetical protein H6907_19975 [Hyphomicrobiales bacterium]|nr:hypothetical protein [Hyphomicrobiales bacterium]MCP5374018.1 hypothetical protein [Hyphomicrobiales bacterium]
MLAEETDGLRQQLAADNVIFFYDGYLNEEVLTGLGNAVKAKLTMEFQDSRKARNVFSVLVEEVQNIIRHSAAVEHGAEGVAEQELRSGSVAIGRSGDGYFVASGNLVRKEDVGRLRASLEHLKTQDQDGLKQLYRQTLRDEVPMNGTSVGLGFIEIARRSTNGIEFDFVDVDDRHAYFGLRAKVG